MPGAHESASALGAADPRDQRSDDQRNDDQRNDGQCNDGQRNDDQRNDGQRNDGQCSDGLCADDSHHHGYILDKDRYLARLRRIEGQARGIHRMVDDERYCIDILTQISALTKSLESVAVGLLEDHVRHCVLDAAAAGDPEAKLREATDAIRRLL